LVAHELAHVVQQRAGVSLKGGVGESGDRYEQEADAAARAVVTDQPVKMPGASERGAANPDGGQVQTKSKPAISTGKKGKKADGPPKDALGLVNADGKVVATDVRDPVFEQLAHRIAYMTPKEAVGQKEWLSRHGYTIGKFYEDTTTGMQCVSLKPKPVSRKGKLIKMPPVLAFRGTDTDKGNRELGKDAAADLRWKAVGYGQFAANRPQIVNLLASLGGRAVVTGHSLGGALAQLTGCYFPGMVQRIVTFQAPGIDSATAKKLADYNKANPGKKVDSTHYVAKGDLVSKAGQNRTANSDGTTDVIGYLPEKKGAKGAHTSYLLSGKSKHVPRMSRADGSADPITRDPSSAAEWGRKMLSMPKATFTALFGEYSIKNSLVQFTGALWSKYQSKLDKGGKAATLKAEAAKEIDKFTSMLTLSMEKKVPGLKIAIERAKETAKDGYLTPSQRQERSPERRSPEYVKAEAKKMLKRLEAELAKLMTELGPARAVIAQKRSDFLKAIANYKKP